MIMSSLRQMGLKICLCPQVQFQCFYLSKYGDYNFIPSVSVRHFSKKNSDGKSQEQSHEFETDSALERRHDVQFEKITEDSKLINSTKCDNVVSDEETHLQPALSTLVHEKILPGSALKTAAVVPGKGPPPEPPVTCCMSGCANCVWIAYAEELKTYYNDGGEMAKSALEKIEDPSLRAFVKLELGL